MEKTIIISLMILSAFSSCTTLDFSKIDEQINTTMNSWKGTHYSEMMLKWSPPTYSADDGRGGNTCISVQ